MLNSWLVKCQNEFPAWTRRYPGDWDFTAESMDQLDELVLGQFTDATELDDPANRDFIEGATWRAAGLTRVLIAFRRPHGGAVGSVNPAIGRQCGSRGSAKAHRRQRHHRCPPR